MAQATDSHHTTLGELVSAQVSCERRGSQGGNSLPHIMRMEEGSLHQPASGSGNVFHARQYREKMAR